MGTKIILSFLLIGNIAYCQSNGKIHLLKQYSLQKCLKINYRSVDSSFISHDYSASYMLQIKKGDYNMLNKVDDFILKNSTNMADHHHHLHIRREGYNPNYREVNEL